MVEEDDVWVDVRATSSAARNDLILYNWDWIFGIVEGRVWLDDKRERKLRLLEKGVCGWHGVKRRPNIFWWAIRVWRWSDAGLRNT